MRQRWSEDDIREWFHGTLSKEQRGAWLKAAEDGPVIPDELLDTLPADRRMGKPGSQVVLIGAYWPDGKPAGQPVQLKPEMVKELYDFVLTELDRS